MTDRRSGKVAVVTTATLDAPLTAPGSPAARLVAMLERDGWGLVQLPPATLSTAARRRALVIVLDQLEDYLCSGYRVALALAEGDDRAVLRRLRALSAARRMVWSAEPSPSPLAGAWFALRRDAPG